MWWAKCSLRMRPLLQWGQESQWLQFALLDTWQKSLQNSG